MGYTIGMVQLLHYRAGTESASQNKVTASKIICQAYIGMQCPTAHALIKLNQTEVVTQVFASWRSSQVTKVESSHSQVM